MTFLIILVLMVGLFWWVAAVRSHAVRTAWQRLFVPELDNGDCGAACLAMVLRFYGREVSPQWLGVQTQYTPEEGSNLLELSKTAEKQGLKAKNLRMPLDKLGELPLPAILHWDGHYFVVLFRVTRTKFGIAHPGEGLLTLSRKSFLRRWAIEGEQGICLALEPAEPD